MSPQPTLTTHRLLLRPFRTEDGPDVKRLAGDPAVAADATAIPYPFEDGMAEAWIASHARAFEAGTQAIFALTRREDGALVGAAGLTLDPGNRHAELGYWVGRPYWGGGYATEACEALVRYGFEALALHRIHGNCLRRNPASARVMRKLGMVYEGCLRQHALHRGVFEDLEVYGLLKAEAGRPV
jgi:RimJ/RimL family protein N-acetyltransferase